MNRKAGKMFLLTGMLCIISFAVCACGRVEEAAKAQESFYFPPFFVNYTAID